MLPAPVERYWAVAVGDRPAVRTATVRHRGSFFLSPAANASAIEGEQLFIVEPPGFLWSARIDVVPGVRVDARDLRLGDEGSMRVLIDDSFTVADTSGPQLNQGSALRLLAEMPWYPTALFDERRVTWGAIDETHASVTLRLDSLEVSAVFEFGADGLPASVTAQSFDDQGVLTRLGGVYCDYRRVSGLLVPFEVEVRWQPESGPFTSGHWLIDSVEYDQPRNSGA